MLCQTPIFYCLALTKKCPQKILIIGGGDGGSLEEVLKHKIEKAWMVEIDKKVIEISRKYLPSISKRAFKNKPTDNLREELNDLQRQLVEIGDDQDLLTYENILPRIQRVQREFDENTAYNKLLENIGNTYNLMVTGDGKHRTSTTRKRSEVEDLEKN